MACKHPIGVACHCNQKGNCLVHYQITSDAGLFVFRNGDVGRRIIKLVDKGEGTKVNIAVEGCCINKLATCPTGYLTDNIDYSEALTALECKTHTLRYRPLPDMPGRPDKEMDLYGAIQNLLAEDKSTALNYTRYKVCITQCAGKPQAEQTLWLSSSPVSYWLGQIAGDTFIDVYPKTEIESDLTFSFSPSKERWLSKFERKEEGRARRQLGDLKPAPKNEVKEELTISGNLSITKGSCKTEYTSSATHNRSNLVKGKKLSSASKSLREQWKLFDSLLDMAEKIKGGTYRNQGKDKVNVLDCDFGATNIKLAGKLTHDVVDSAISSSGTVSLGFTPLFEFKMTLDLVLALATYFKLAQVVAEVQEQARILEEKVKAGEVGTYVGAEFCIVLATKLDTTGFVSFMPNQPLSYGLDAVVPVSISLLGNVRGGAKIWTFEGSFNIQGEIIAEANLALKSKVKEGKPLVELVFFHGGIKVKVKIDISGSVNNGKTETATGDSSKNVGRENASQLDVKKAFTEEWQWVDGISVDNSPFRTTLIGG